MINSATPFGTLAIIATLLSLSIQADVPAPTPGALAATIRPFFGKYCTECHGEKKQKGKLRLDNLPIDHDSHGNAAEWEEILLRITDGDMPPEDETQPPPETTAAIAEWITGLLHEGDKHRQAGAGERVSFRRISREEYANTIRDLLGVTFDVTSQYGLPEDPDWHGFERIGSVLTLSPAHVEKYLRAANEILDEALSIKPQPKREIVRWDAFWMRDGRRQKEYEARGIADQARIELVPNNYHTDVWNVPIDETGEYELRIKLSGLRPKDGPAPRLKVYLPDVNVTLLEQDVIAPEDEPITITKRIHLRRRLPNETKGKYAVFLKNDVPGPNPEARRSRHNPVATGFTNVRNRVPWQLKLTDDDYNPIEPTLIIDHVEWDGPIHDQWPTAAHQEIFFPGNEDEAHARAILAKFAERAWRRPVTAAEIDPLLKPVRVSLELGDDFQTAVRSGLLAILCSNSFLYLEEGDVSAYRGQLNDWELASRLSYFLWSSMPDQRLLDLAKAGTLSQPETLLAETRRMLADDRAQAFTDSFPRQWLQLGKVGMFPPDNKLYPDYDLYLENSMISETVGFFGEVFKQNASINQFLNSDWTMLNERLARHYEIDGVSGDQLRRVALKPEHRRGGILTHGSILGLTSDGTRHRPVHRGVWMLESIIGKPAPPPPANVPALDTPDAGQKKMTIREKLELHRSDPNCTSCHNKIDPLGMAFDNYDAIGRWRDVETVAVGKGANPKLDASGILPDGRQFANSAELRQLLLDDCDQFAIALVDKLATYGMRRGMTFSDKDLVKTVATEAKADDYRLRTMIEALVTSPLFLKR